MLENLKHFSDLFISGKKLTAQHTNIQNDISDMKKILPHSKAKQ